MVNKLTMTEVLEPFIKQPKEELHLSSLSRELNIPHPTLRLILEYFEKEAILKKDTKGRLTLYKLNINHPNIIDYLTIAEKNKIIKQCNDNLLLQEFISSLLQILEENTKALIFGSTVDSLKTANDIDLLIIGKINKKEISALSKKVNKEVHLIEVKQFTSITKALKNEIIKKHLILIGSEEIIRWIIKD
ncbi:hypothetical protein HZA96_06435 [Candidatus Woesearchaeota archaeon]|nr:hypothetical protein [Candidatus Woesearchaeota archaeon]